MPLLRSRSKKRREFIRRVSSIPEGKRVYVDESALDGYQYRSQVRAPRGITVLGLIPGRRFARERFIAAKCGNEILTPVAFQGTADSTFFNHWVENDLVPELESDQVVVMDNARSTNQLKPEN